MQAMKEHIIGGGYICMMEKAGRDFVQQGLHAVGICGEGIPSASERGGDNDELYFRII